MKFKFPLKAIDCQELLNANDYPELFNANEDGELHVMLKADHYETLAAAYHASGSYQLEISTLSKRVAELEDKLEEEETRCASRLSMILYLEQEMNLLNDKLKTGIRVRSYKDSIGVIKIDSLDWPEYSNATLILDKETK